MISSFYALCIMLDANTAYTFFFVSLMLGLTPGPDNIIVLLQSARHGRKAGLFVTLGLCTGLLVHTSAVALGLAAVLAASAVAFTVIKLVGAAYLLLLAWKAFHAPISRLQAHTLSAPTWRMYRRGFIMNLTNPKVGIFFLAFLPQFVRPDAGPVAIQVLLLGGIFVVATMLVFGSLAWFADLLGAKLQGSLRAQTLFNRATALVFLGLAARLAWSDR